MTEKQIKNHQLERLVLLAIQDAKQLRIQHQVETDAKGVHGLYRPSYYGGYLSPKTNPILAAFPRKDYGPTIASRRKHSYVLPKLWGAFVRKWRDAGLDVRTLDFWEEDDD